MGSSNKSILKTLLYSDIFDYPLSKEEIWKYLISKKKENYHDFINHLSNKETSFGNKNNYFFLNGRDGLVIIRTKKEKESLKKIKFAQKIISSLTIIPTVRFIGISGALAMKNSDEGDDIDLFIISSKNSVWITRLLMVLVLKILGVYRERNGKNISNKICLNMLIDEASLLFPKKRRDLYTAHEIAQIMPMFQKDNIYEKFIYSNNWISKFLPNAFDKKEKFLSANLNITDKIFNWIFEIFPIEVLLKNIQIRYMKNHLTKETILDNFIAFHPFDYKTYVLKTYAKKLAKFNIVFNTRGY